MIEFNFENIYWLISSGLFGLLLGSFTNVLIYRIPKNESIVFPGSHCPECGVPIKYYDNIPVISYLFLGGKCRYCSGKIPIKYPAVEIITSLMVMWIFYVDGMSMNFFADTFLGILLISATAIDAKYMIIPDKLTYTGMIVGTLLSLRMGMGGLLRAGGGILTGVLVLSIMYFLGKIIYKKDSVGFGDFKLIAVTGIFTGPMWNLVIIFIAIIIGGIWGMFMLLTRRTKREQEIPFGPFIASGAFAVIFLKKYIILLIQKYLELM